MSTRSTLSIVLIVYVQCMLASHAFADVVVLIDKPPFHNVGISNFRDGRVHFRGMSKEVLRKPLSVVERVAVDRYPILTKAELLTRTAPTQAIEAYTLALSEVEEEWFRDFIRVRLLVLHDRAGFFEEAVAEYVKLLETMPGFIQELEPRHPGQPGSGTNRRARETLLTALSAKSQRSTAPVLRRLILDLMLYDEVDPLPPGFSVPGSGSGQAASQPAEEPPLLFAPAATEKRSPRPLFGNIEQTEEYQPIALRDDCLVFAGIRQALDTGEAERARRLLKRVQPYMKKKPSDTWLLLSQRGRILDGEYGPAANALLALSEETADRALAGEALYYVGWAHEKMSRADVARGIYGELVKREDLPANISSLARQGLKRLGE